MLSVNITELRANLLNYLNKAQRGEQITVDSNGLLLVTVVAPVDQKQLAKTQLKTLAVPAKIHDVTLPLDEQREALK